MVAKTVSKKTIGLAHMHFAPSGDSCGLVRTKFASLDASCACVHASMRNLNSTRGGAWHAQQGGAEILFYTTLLSYTQPVAISSPRMN